MPTTISEVVPIEVSVLRSEIDGRLVVQIDTAFGQLTSDEHVRVFLNDAVLYDGNPNENENAYSLLEKLHDQDKATPWSEYGTADVRNGIELAWRQIAEGQAK